MISIPKISIIIPIYNSKLYLFECLDSVINQTLQEIEIICINDGSTDSSPQIIEEYVKKDSRVKVINKQILKNLKVVILILMKQIKQHQK